MYHTNICVSIVINCCIILSSCTKLVITLKSAEICYCVVAICSIDGFMLLMLLMYFQEVVTAVVDLEEVRAYRNDIRSRCVQVSVCSLQ